MTDKTSKETAFVLAAFLVSGAAALIYEVAWTRALSLVLGSTVYALSTMLSTFMSGLALGSYWGGKLSDRKTNLLFLFALCELGVGASALATVPLIYRMPEVYLFVYRSLHAYPTLFFTVQILLCATVMLIPTILMGASFPLVSRRITSNLAEMGKKVGDAYSLNTVGAVLGSLGVGFYLIPTFGVKGATAFAACLNLLVGILMLLLSGKRVIKTLLFSVPIFALVALWAGSARLEAGLLNFYSVNRQLDGKPYESIVETDRREMREIFYEEHPQGPVKGFRSTNGSLILQVGGKIEGTNLNDLPNTVLLAYLPAASHPAPGNFLTIGLGSGITLAAAKEQVAKTDLVEINPGVINAVRRHGQPGVLDGVNLILNDARNYLLLTEKKYDIISSEPSYPTESGVASLFTREFFEIASRKLNPGGVYCQWLPYYILTNDDVTMMLKTFGSVFPHVYLWKIQSSGDLIMVGGNEPFRFTAEEIRSRITGLNRLHDYPLRYELSRTPEQIAEIVRKSDVPINTDDSPRLEFHAVSNLIVGDLSLIEKKQNP